MKDTLTVAIDFDGTIVENAYPKIGKPIIFAFETIKKLQENRHRVILWTYRRGKELEQAVAFCEKHGITFYAVNMSFQEEDYDTSYSRKINADLFIDDRNIGGMKSWGEIYQEIIGEQSPQKPSKKKGWFNF